MNVLRHRLHLWLVLLAVPLFASAQSVPPATSPATKGPLDAQEERVELSPFVVNAEDDQGYSSRFSTSGSRLPP